MTAPALPTCKPTSRHRSRSRRKGRKIDGPFVALPLDVLKSSAYIELSHPAKALLIEVAMQFHGDDNGRMIVTRKHLRTRGWSSADVIHRAKDELLRAGFIFETVTGRRPNLASWYACTWWALDHHRNYEAGISVATFPKGAYRRENASLSPAGGTRSLVIGPPAGTEKPSPVPSGGTMSTPSCVPAVPGDGHPLEKPSAAGCCAALAATGDCSNDASTCPGPTGLQ